MDSHQSGQRGNTIEIPVPRAIQERLDKRDRLANLMAHLLRQSDNTGKYETDNLAAEVRDVLGMTPAQWGTARRDFTSTGCAQFEPSTPGKPTRTAIINLASTLTAIELGMFPEEHAAELTGLIHAKQSP